MQTAWMRRSWRIRALLRSGGVGGPSAAVVAAVAVAAAAEAVATACGSVARRERAS